MKRHLVAAFVATFALAAAYAGAQDITKDFDPAFDFSKIKTYSIEMGTRWGNQLSEDRVLNDIAEAISEKGWKRVPTADAANARVVVHGSTDMKHNVTTFYSGGWGGYGYYGWGGGMGSSSTMVSEYKVGTLVVDIFDQGTKKLIFRGTATDELNDNPQKNIKKSDKAAQKMFKEFPPKPKSTK